MRQVGIRELKDNPTRAVRAARDEPVVITSRDDPEAMLLSLHNLGEHEPDVRLGIATTLFEQGSLSLGRAARLASLSIEAFMEHLGSRGIPVFRTDPTDLDQDLATLRG
jgi:predicted HTH domain antitoxin